LTQYLKHNGPLVELQNVTVIVVTYNSAHCLPSLGKCLDLCPNIVVVDNGSDDGTAAEVAHHLPQARFMALGRNFGFGAANNKALHEVRTPFALLLNPDCEITAEAC
jgi:N-acetylglucosaminyl-diphospho-decaprenol L-rhamnosyltransferase